MGNRLGAFVAQDAEAKDRRQVDHRDDAVQLPKVRALEGHLSPRNRIHRKRSPSLSPRGRRHSIMERIDVQGNILEVKGIAQR